MATTPNQIQHVRELIKSGKRAQALTQLARLIERDHNNAELWWLLANATDDVHQARRALEEVLSLEPANDRARKMLDRLETRQLLKQMGVTKTQEVRRTPMALPLVLIFVAISGLLVVLALALNNQQPEQVAVLPTALDLPTETATLPPTQTTAPTTVIIPEITADTDTTDATPTDDPFAPTSDVEGIATEIPAATDVVVTEDPALAGAQVTVETSPETDATILPESTADQTQVAVVSTMPLEPTIELSATPTADPAITLPETTQDPLPLDAGGQGTQVAFVGTPVDDVFTQPTVDPALGIVTTTDPASTVDLAFVDPLTGGATTTEARAAIPEQEALDRGQVLDGVARRDLIKPYGVHSWTFSGYRDETITLELVNITGRGNPSLELRDETGAVVTSDIDTVDTSNVDSLIQIKLPSDGIYTVIVRMAAVDEQLYRLTLTRQ
jgi:hypothetical protein